MKRIMLFLAYVVVLSTVLALAAVAFRWPHQLFPQPCTHGVSSIGPVRLVNGRITGAVTPHTEACLR